MTTYNLVEAKTHLGELIAKAQAGETVLIARRGVPIARLTATEPAPKASDQPPSATEWPREILEFQGIPDMEPFEAARATFAPSVMDPLA
jgi:prevent-host-death family protein